MPHLSTSVTVAPAATVVTPIAGNSAHGGACGDGSGKALYGVYDGTNFSCYRTIGSAKTFVTQDDSVEFLSTIVAGPFFRNRNCALTNIGGTIYANVTGGDGTNWGQWIYRDTGGGGVGPWVKHGTVTEFANAGEGGPSDRLDFLCNGGEIIVFDANNWAVASGRGVSGNVRYGLAKSTDGGVSWAIVFDYLVATLGFETYDFHTVGPTFGRDNLGRYWMNWLGNEANPIRAYSSDNTWTTEITLTEDGNAARSFQFSIGDRLYAITNGAGVAVGAPFEPLQYTDDTPTAGPWTTVQDLNPAGIPLTDAAEVGVYNVGSERRPILAGIKQGKVLNLGEGAGGWRLWVSE